MTEASANTVRSNSGTNTTNPLLIDVACLFCGLNGEKHSTSYYVLNCVSVFLPQVLTADTDIPEG